MLIFHCPQKSQILQLKVQTSHLAESPAVTQTFIRTSRKRVELYLFTPPRRLPPHICSEQCKPGLPPPDSSSSRKFDYRPRKETGATADPLIGPKYLLTKKMPIALVLMENSFATPVNKCCASSQIACWCSIKPLSRCHVRQRLLHENRKMNNNRRLHKNTREIPDYSDSAEGGETRKQSAASSFDARKSH